MAGRRVFKPSDLPVRTTMKRFPVELHLVECADVLDPVVDQDVRRIRRRRRIRQRIFPHQRAVNRSGLGFERRWVIYNGYVEASTIPPGWHGWMHHMVDAPPTARDLHGAGVASPPAQYDRDPRRAAADRLDAGANRRPKATGNYKPWTPDPKPQRSSACDAPAPARRSGRKRPARPLPPPGAPASWRWPRSPRPAPSSAASPRPSGSAPC